MIDCSIFGDCNNDCWQYYENNAIEALLSATMIKNDWVRGGIPQVVLKCLNRPFGSCLGRERIPKETSLKYNRSMTGRTMKEWYTQQVRSLPRGDGTASWIFIQVSNIYTTAWWIFISHIPTTTWWIFISHIPTSAWWIFISHISINAWWILISHIPTTVWWILISNIPTSAWWIFISHIPTTAWWIFISHISINAWWILISHIPTTVWWIFISNILYHCFVDIHITHIYHCLVDCITSKWHTVFVTLHTLSFH